MVETDRFVRGLRALYRVLQVAREKKIDFVAGGITYYEFFSLIPLLLLLFFLLSTLGGQQIAMFIILQAGTVFPAVGEELASRVLAMGTGRTGVIGVLVLFWAAIQLFRSFDIAFEEIYDVEHVETLFQEVEDTITAVLTTAIAAGLTVTTALMLASSPENLLAQVGWTVLQFAGLTMAFILLYHVFTRQTYTLTHLLPGALLAAAGWTVLQAGFHTYTQIVGESLYSVFGGVFLLVFWMYIGNILILLGAVVNMVRNHDHNTPL